MLGLTNFGLLNLANPNPPVLDAVALLWSGAEATFPFGSGPLGVSALALGEIAGWLWSVASWLACKATCGLGGEAALRPVFEISGGFGRKFGGLAGVWTFGGEAVVTACITTELRATRTCEAAALGRVRAGGVFAAWCGGAADGTGIGAGSAGRKGCWSGGVRAGLAATAFYEARSIDAWLAFGTVILALDLDGLWLEGRIQRFAKLVDLFGREVAKLSGLKIEGERAVADALDLLDVVADLLEHAADLAIASFGEGHLEPGIFLVHGKLDDALAG